MSQTKLPIVLDISFSVFEGNYLELKKSLEFFSSHDSDFLLAESKMQDRDNFYKEIIRLLHNYVASAKSLIDHSRIHYKTFWNTVLMLDKTVSLS